MGKADARCEQFGPGIVLDVGVDPERRHRFVQGEFLFGGHAKDDFGSDRLGQRSDIVESACVCWRATGDLVAVVSSEGNLTAVDVCNGGARGVELLKPGGHLLIELTFSFDVSSRLGGILSREQGGNE
jgi:hypothetical protein